MSDNKTNDSIIDKYLDMADTRDDYDCVSNSNFMTPTMGEMIQEDLMNEILQQYVDDEVSNGINERPSLEKSSYYVETPFSTSPGYYPDKGVFILKAYELDEDKYTWPLNKVDGDTTSYKLSSLEDGNAPFTMTNGKTYSSFKDYFKKTIGGDKLTIRHVGLNTPEIPHLEVQAVAKSAAEKYMVKNMSMKEVRALKSSGKNNIGDVTYLKYKKEKKNNIDVVSDRDDSERAKMLVFKDGNTTHYKEIIEDEESYKIITPTEIEGYNANYNYYLIVSEDDSEKHTLLDGYKGQRIVKQMIEESDDMIIMVNAAGLSAGRTVPNTNGMQYNSIFYTSKAVEYLLQEWNRSYENIPETNHKYNPYGTDKYGRSLGAIYVK